MTDSLRQAAAIPPGFPRHWRLCDITEPTGVQDIHLDPGPWVLGFAASPPPSRRGGLSTVDTPDRATAALKLMLTAEANDGWNAHGGNTRLSLTDVVMHEVAAALARGVDPYDPATR